MGRKRGERNGLPTRDAIYEAAVELICERGYHGTSLRDVASAVNLQMSTLYYYYPSKQALLLAIMEASMSGLTQAVAESMFSANGPRAKMIAGIRAHVMFQTHRRGENLVADTEIRSLNREARVRIIRMRDDYQEMFAVVMEDGIRSDAFRSTDVSVSLAGLFAMLNGVASWYSPDGYRSLSEIADQYCELFLNGLSTRRKSISTGSSP